MSKKPIIVFEGIEGSGKTFHIDNVSNYLKRKKIPYLKIREPGGSRNSEIIRKIILNKKSSFNKNTDFLLKGIKVNFTFLNIVNSKNMILRLKERKELNRYDKFKMSFYDKVQKGFLKLMKKKKKNTFMIIDSNQSINDNKKIVINKIDKLI